MEALGRLGWVMAVALCAASAIKAGPLEPDPGSEALIRIVLVDHRTVWQLDDFVGHAAARCMPSSPDRQVCVWHLDPRSRAFATLAAILDTRDRLSLLCEVASGERERSPASCTAQPRRSNRDALRQPAAADRQRPAVARSDRGRV